MTRDTLVYAAGRKGCGKSHLLQSIVLSHLREYPGSRFVVWDTTGEWSEMDWTRGRLEVLTAIEWSCEQAAEYAIEVAESFGGCVLVVDEIDRVVPNHAGGLKADTALHAVVHYGRHHNTALLCAARRPRSVHTDIPALADVLFLFRMTNARDLKWIADLAGPHHAAVVQQLPPHDFVRIDLDEDT